MSPNFIFRIDEIRESLQTAASYDRYGIWNPSTDSGGNERMNGHGATGMWWYCNGQNIQRLNVNAPPHGSSHFQTFSVFYCDGFGFWVLRGDATSPPAAEAWHPLSFDWDEHDYSAYLTNAGYQRTLRVQRNDQMWPRMLLPTTNQVPPVTTSQRYGGLKGDLAIFLALIALSMDRPYVPHVLPQMFAREAWTIHQHPHGRLNQRGVVVYVYTVPASWDPTGKSTAKELKNYQDGVHGKYYY
ncbi:uncharacterized protein CC84DRAFT_1218200 [Paraphaeosphaeria sporulosa]|uniref:Uncharacterized protein n=1 Tax=Paraphaeosphaeria sporulosa TaxID=1460663 RepID=A0A177CAK1_9PLEO|nr:uncharacterized protein CC84DRAFT_1218200 [Paraphaeosphaeria sporulosa]OAG04774.1 hypothetical protein CC84DRAFT_1218200 [Paraphaeosphaeria sporulosa]